LARGNDFRATLHIYNPPKDLPYDRKELGTAENFINELGSGDISQKRLAEALEKFANEERKADGLPSFFTSGYFATAGSFRDTDEYSVPCILDRDMEKVKECIESRPKKPYDGFIINVPRKGVNPPDEKPSWLPKYLGVAQWEGNYNVRSGFSTKNLEEVDLG
jgi:CRISPR-associated endonuclease/helicase Cas3